MRTSLLLPFLAASIAGAQDKPAKIAAKDLPFNDGVVQTAFQKMDAAAAALAKPGWTVLPYRNLTFRGGPARYVAEWRQSGDGKGDLDLREPIPNRFVQLTGSALAMAGERIDGLHLCASNIPKKGWGARIEYQTYNGKAAVGEGFNMFFFHDDFNQTRPGGRGKWAIELGNSYFGATKRLRPFTYSFQVSTHGDPKTWMGDTRTPRNRQAERFLASPKAFLDAALAELDALEAHALKQIPSEAAILRITEDRRDGLPPMEVKLGPDNQMSKKELTAILAEAIADIDQRRKLVRAHHQDMFLAAQAAFPLLDRIERKADKADKK